jgi:hypothetical protein
MAEPFFVIIQIFIHVEHQSENNMTPAVYDLTVYQGNTFERSLRLRLSDGAYIDFTGWSLKAQIRRKFDDKDPLAEFNISLDSNPEVIKMVLPPTESQKLPKAEGTKGLVWDLRMVDTSGKVKTYLRGSVNVMPSVTR